MMSADNMICVQRRSKWWWVWMDYASNKKLTPKHDKMRRKFASEENAIEYAKERAVHEAVVEYVIFVLRQKP